MTSRAGTPAPPCLPGRGEVETQLYACSIPPVHSPPPLPHPPPRRFIRSGDIPISRALTGPKHGKAARPGPQARAQSAAWRGVTWRGRRGGAGGSRRGVKLAVIGDPLKSDAKTAAMIGSLHCPDAQSIPQTNKTLSRQPPCWTLQLQCDSCIVSRPFKLGDRIHTKPSSKRGQKATPSATLQRVGIPKIPKMQ